MEVCGRQARRLSGVLRPPLRRGGAAEFDPERHFATANYCIAKGSFNNLVGEDEQGGWNSQAERFGSFEIDD